VGSPNAALGEFTNLIFNTQTVRATTITFADQAGPEGSNSLLSIAGQNEATIFRTRITADVSGSANIVKLVFNHAAVGVTGSDFKLKVDSAIL